MRSLSFSAPAAAVAALLLSAPSSGVSIEASSSSESACRSAVRSIQALARAGDVPGTDGAAPRVLDLCRKPGVSDASRAEALLETRWANSATLAQAAAKTELAYSIVSKLETRGRLLIRATEDLSEIRFMEHKPEEVRLLLADIRELREEVFGTGSAEEVAGHSRYAVGLISLAQLCDELGATDASREHLDSARIEAEQAFARALSRFGRGHAVTEEAAIGLQAARLATGAKVDSEDIDESDVEPFQSSSDAARMD